MALNGDKCEDPYEKEEGETGLVVFRNVVRLLKHFCKMKGIYGSNSCFFNGMTL
jgi:hypothetical protein